ncbi:MAG: methyltransferase domain-containing protein [bacterium]|nr:methyltransferase domain-containing protein [bacterium]
MAKEEQPEISYFGVQAYIGSTKHGGGQDSTDDLIKLCSIRKGSRVLDVGCGPGLTAIRLARMGCEVVAIDLNKRMIERAKENASSAKADISFMVADAQKLPFKKNEFDAVISESVTVFVPDRKKAMGEYVRVTKPGGFIGLNEIFWRKEPPKDMVAKVMKLYELRDNIPNLESWKSMLKAAGLGSIKAIPHNLIDKRALSRMKRIGIMHTLRILWRTIYGYVKFSGFRGYLNNMARLPKSFPGYLSYGIFVGKK